MSRHTVGSASRPPSRLRKIARGAAVEVGLQSTDGGRGEGLDETRTMLNRKRSLAMQLGKIASSQVKVVT